jgi:hypothetical protein
VNVLGFAAMVNVAVAHLEGRRSGHLVGISSLAALTCNQASSTHAWRKVIDGSGWPPRGPQPARSPWRSADGSNVCT